MGIENDGTTEPRDPKPIELVEARIDYQLRDIYEVLEEELPKIADEMARAPIREFAMRYMRTSYGKGITDISEDPDIVKKIYEGIGPAAE